MNVKNIDKASQLFFFNLKYRLLINCSKLLKKVSYSQNESAL